MFIQALQAQIDQASADIERQKELLKNLERNKSLLQRQLNDLRDRIARLPLEISSDIFIRCLPSRPGPEIFPSIPMLFLEICSTWTDIALSTPALWARVHFELSRPRGFNQLLTLWFQRSGGHPLHISVTGLMDDDVATIPRPLPLLQSLFICGREDLTLESLPFIQLLRLSPTLFELTIREVEFDEGVNIAAEKLVLPKLCRLIFGCGFDGTAEYDVLTFIFAPHLETLRLGEGTSYDDWRITSFLDRSKPPLQELILDGPENSDGADELYSLLARVATVTRLDLRSPQQSTMEDLFKPLAETPCGILQSLQTPRIHSSARKFQCPMGKRDSYAIDSP
ncbi:hypothetical protein FB45DRAFT_1054162 [Roridomyces roridus]|uniref:F-box domain-containing protein n=1 Tax=Roridomyces roridus TaxID=1738132 RepID=A0AAD7CA33_9AGAR|nr:hypothetical protein FB45DRAFT_1054162 [Roridomyces roridus]